MAHTDACKIQVCQFVEKCTDAGMSLNQACKETEKESGGIPEGTIKRWWYEIERENKEQFRNELPELTHDSYTENPAGQENEMQAKKWPICSRCHYGKVEKNYRTGEPNKSGLCRSCRRAEVTKKKVSEARKAWNEIPNDTEAEVCWTKIIKDLDEALDRNLDLGNLVFGKVGNEVLERITNFQRKFDGVVWHVVEPSLPPGG